jgi:hypothetical protein
MSGKTPTPNSITSQIKIYEIELTVNGYMKRTMPILPTTIKGWLRNAVSIWLYERNAWKECAVSVRRDSAGPAVLRLYEPMPTEPCWLRIRLSPLGQLFGVPEKQILKVAGGDAQKAVTLGKLARAPRVRIVFTEQPKYEVVEIDQGVLDSINAVDTGNPHKIKLMKMTSPLRFRLFVRPEQYDGTPIMEKVALPPETAGKPLATAMQYLLDKAIELAVNSYATPALGGREFHQVKVKIVRTEEQEVKLRSLSDQELKLILSLLR